MLHAPWPWLKQYPDAVTWDDDLPKHSVYQMLENTAKAFGDRPAFDFLDKIWTWDEIKVAADRIAIGLQNIGVGRGTKVGLCLPNTPYFLMAWYGIAKTGATIVHYNPLYAARELAQQIEDSNTDIMFTLDLKVTYDKLAPMLQVTRLNQIVVCPFVDLLPFPKNLLFPIVKFHEIANIPNDDRHIPWQRLLNGYGEFTDPEIDPDRDIALLQYTGGTTGTPKGAMLSHTNIVANTEQCMRWFHDHRPGVDKMLGVIPFFHVFAMTAVMNLSVRCGFQIIATPRFELKQTLKLIEKKKPVIFPAVPAIFSAINAHPSSDKYDLTSLKYCVSGGAPLPVEVKRSYEAKTGCVLVEGYGLTEASPVVCVNPTDGDNRAGSIGFPLPQTIVEIIDPETGQLMGKNERGEVCVRGPQVMLGYWNRADESEKVLRHGRLHTGDIGMMDAEGYTYIVDRLKDMIITNGYNVYPRNIEEVLYEHPAIEECVVAGIPDAQRGEAVKAWVKLRNGTSASEESLKEFMRTKLASMEIPRVIEIRDTPLPKTMIGKLSRKDLLAEEAAAATKR